MTVMAGRRLLSRPSQNVGPVKAWGPGMCALVKAPGLHRAYGIAGVAWTPCVEGRKLCARSCEARRMSCADTPDTTRCKWQCPHVRSAVVLRAILGSEHTSL